MWKGVEKMNNTEVWCVSFLSLGIILLLFGMHNVDNSHNLQIVKSWYKAGDVVDCNSVGDCFGFRELYNLGAMQIFVSMVIFVSINIYAFSKMGNTELRKNVRKNMQKV